MFKQGGWWVRLYVNGREKWFRSDTKSQAKTLYGRLRSEARENRYFPEKYAVSKELTLRTWIARYLEGVTSPGLRNVHRYGKFWSKLLGRKLLTEISADDLRHIQAKMKQKGTRTARTINRYFGALRRILNLAIADGLLPANPVKGVKFFSEPAGRLRFLSDREISNLRETLTPEHWSIVAFALETGLRLTEQFHSRWDCLNTEQGILTIPLSKSGKTPPCHSHGCRVRHRQGPHLMDAQSFSISESSDLRTTDAGTKLCGEGLRTGFKAGKNRWSHMAHLTAYVCIPGSHGRSRYPNGSGTDGTFHPPR